MSDVVKKVLVNVGVAVILVVLGWFVNHALGADQYPTQNEVREEYVPREIYELQVGRMQLQWDRMERKLDAILVNQSDRGDD